AGIEPWAWIINNSLMLTTSSSALLQQRALNEQQFLAQVIEQHAKRWAVVPLQLEDPTGIARLQQLCRH
ncbi:MAG: arsenical pump-driving ATPase, partial [Tolumonas sp.]|nr:arsenical pump-driving ATPase [Tolumonas sp.]